MAERDDIIAKMEGRPVGQNNVMTAAPHPSFPNPDFPVTMRRKDSGLTIEIGEEGMYQNYMRSGRWEVVGPLGTAPAKAKAPAKKKASKKKATKK